MPTVPIPRAARRSSLAVMAALAAAIMVAFALNQDVIWGDPDVYRSRLVDAWHAGFPFGDALFEHLPGMLVPMGAAWLLGGFASVLTYRWIFMGLMAACLFVTFDRVDAAGNLLGIRGAGIRWLVIAGPLFPLVLFRSDPWVVALAAAATVAALAGARRSEVLLGWGGVVSKGWPVVLAALAWWNGRRALAAGYVGVLVATLAFVLSLPGFRSGRTFEGIHSETIVGSVLLLWRAATGRPLELLAEAGATYTAAPGWTVAIGPVLAAAIAWPALRVLLRRDAASTPIPALATLVVGVLVASPLLSPQFVLWATPFLALIAGSRIRWAATGITASTMLYMLWWTEMLHGSIPLLGLLVARNGALLAVGVAAAQLAARPLTGAAP